MIEEEISFASREDKFEIARRRTGLFLAPALFVAVLLWPMPAISVEAHKLAAVFALTLTFWVTEAIPLPVAALLGPSLCVVLGIGKARPVFASFADPVIFLLIGSFIIAEAMFIHGLNRRFAFLVLGMKWVGSSGTRILLAYSLVAAIVSMFISNTATTAMLFPIGLSLLHGMSGGKGIPKTSYATGLMLMTAFASTIGGLGTPVGTPPNMIGIGMIEKFLGQRITFLNWMGFALPVVVVLFSILFLVIVRVTRSGSHGFSKGSTYLADEKALLGRWKRGEKNVLVVFIFAVVLWIGPSLVSIVLGAKSDTGRRILDSFPEATVALLAASLLFFLPVDWKNRQFTLSWKEASKIDWGTILLFGGGLALGELMFSTGLAEALGLGLVRVTGVNSVVSITFLFAVVAVLVSEATSNTASANMVIPVAIAVSKAAGVNPFPPALASCLCASMGSMLPVSTPPNAIVYGSGLVPITKMMKYGIVLDVTSILVITAAVNLI